MKPWQPVDQSRLAKVPGSQTAVDAPWSVTVGVLWLIVIAAAFGVRAKLAFLGNPQRMGDAVVFTIIAAGAATNAVDLYKLRQGSRIWTGFFLLLFVGFLGGKIISRQAAGYSLALALIAVPLALGTFYQLIVNTRVGAFFAASEMSDGADNDSDD